MTQSVEVKNLAYDYQSAAGRIQALRNVSFKLEPSEFLCILGPSGCGKTTLLNCLAGFLSPSHGEILLSGKPIIGHAFDRGIVFQDVSQLFPWRTARRNIEFGLEVRNVPTSERQLRSTALLRLVKLEKFADAYPHELSGGMQQRVAIARALAYNPGILLMDEPFAALDAITRDEMQRQLAHIWEATRKTVVYITHNVLEAVFLGDEVITMTSGGTIKTKRKIDLPRPRDPLSPDFTRIQRELLNDIAH
ncbi:MAG TPA: ABC transporter ATP-binding protein [Pseudolabrys sp.]|nr:ABC transporter ATP-binding protein [Pseudolabrys sp.]